MVQVAPTEYVEGDCGVYYLAMQSPSRAKLISRIPNWMLLVSLVGLLPAVVFVILKMADAIQRSLHGGTPVLTIVHVMDRGNVMTETMIAATPDGRVFRNESTIGFWGAYSRCRGYRSIVPKEWPMQRVDAIIDSPRFQSLQSSRSANMARDVWQVRVPVGNSLRCWRLTQDEINAKDELRPLLEFFQTVKAANLSGPEDPYECEAGWPGHVDNWCGQ